MTSLFHRSLVHLAMEHHDVQNVSQDNDVNQTIGDGSTVTNKIDNSVSQQSGGYGFLGDYMKKYDFFK